MKLSNHVQSPNRLTPEEKKLIESCFCGEKSKSFTNAEGVVLNKGWHISVLTGIDERRINRYLNRVIDLKIKKMNYEE